MEVERLDVALPDHLAVHCLEALLEVVNDVLCDDPEALLRADDGFESRPLGLQLLLPLGLF